MELIEGVVRSAVIICLLAVLLEFLLPDGSMRPYIKLVMGLLLLLAVLQPVWHLLEADALQVFNRADSAGMNAYGWDDVAQTGAALNEQVLADTDAGLQAGLERQIAALINLSADYQVTRVAVELSTAATKDTATDGAQAASARTVQSIAQVTVWLQSKGSAVADRSSGQESAGQQRAGQTEVSEVQPVQVNEISVAARQDTGDTTAADEQSGSDNHSAAGDSTSLTAEQKTQTEKVRTTIAGYYNLRQEQIKIIFN